MFQEFRFVVCAGATISLFAFAAAACGKDYKVLLDRPAKVGQTYSMSASAENHETVTVTLPGALPHKQENALKAHLDCAVRVLAVDSGSGLPSKLECTVKECTRDGKPLLSGGTVFVAEDKAGKTEITINGESVDPKTAEALNAVVETHGPGDPSDSEVFGSTQLQSVGSTWPINSEAAARGLAKSDLPVTKENMKGESKLVAVKDENGTEALEIQSTINVASISGTMPNGAKIESGSFSGEFNGFFPTDPKLMPLSDSETLRMRMNATASTPDNQLAAIEVQADRSQRIAWTMIK